MVFALATCDDGSGPALYAGGDFTVDGGAGADGVARWDGSTWSPLGSGVSGLVRCLVTFDDGDGPALYAGGDLSMAGGIEVFDIARWDGAAWSPLGGGLNESTYPGIATALSMAVFDDGGGPALYAGGSFAFAGDVAASNVARWDGSAWSPLGSGVNDAVESLAAFDDGAGVALCAGGAFTGAGGITANRIARWDGSGWSPLGSGMNGGIAALAVFDGGGGPALFAGGSFTSALDSGDSYLAQWGCPPPIAEVPGCFGNPAVLSALSGAASVGQPFALRLEAQAIASGAAFLSFGLDGTDAAGCGLLVPLVGEILLALSPGPFPLAQAPIRDGSAAFRVAVPSEPSLVGLKVLLQAAGLPIPVGPPLELSTGVAVTITE